ncbi:MAG: hypothetical protein QOG03_209 [Actinomycetota bacterium]|jgi:hypothetical protein|nr:hypothetical protein [Actinomycetota bacterium]
MVIFRTAEGKPGYHQAEALDEAVRFVEHLRNTEQVTDARLFKMEEVPIEFKTYYKVEVVGSHEAATPVEAPNPAPAARLVEEEPAAPMLMEDPLTGEPLPVGPGTPANRFGLRGRS